MYNMDFKCKPYCERKLNGLPSTWKFTLFSQLFSVFTNILTSETHWNVFSSVKCHNRLPSVKTKRVGFKPVIEYATAPRLRHNSTEHNTNGCHCFSPEDQPGSRSALENLLKLSDPGLCTPFSPTGRRSLRRKWHVWTNRRADTSKIMIWQSLERKIAFMWSREEIMKGPSLAYFIM